MRFFPEGWWNINSPDMWGMARAAGPHWVIASLIMLAVGASMRKPTVSTFCAIAHAVIGFDSLCDAFVLYRDHGFPWGPQQFVVLHGAWINALFAWLHWMNIFRLKPDDVVDSETRADNETGPPT